MSNPVLPRRRARDLTSRIALKVRADHGVTTAEYAMVTVCGCSFAAVLMSLIKSDNVMKLVLNLITKAFGLF